MTVVQNTLAGTMICAELRQAHRQVARYHAENKRTKHAQAIETRYVLATILGRYIEENYCRRHPEKTLPMICTGDAINFATERWVRPEDHSYEAFDACVDSFVATLRG